MTRDLGALFHKWESRLNPCHPGWSAAVQSRLIHLHVWENLSERLEMTLLNCLDRMIFKNIRKRVQNFMYFFFRLAFIGVGVVRADRRQPNAPTSQVCLMSTALSSEGIGL